MKPITAGALGLILGLIVATSISTWQAKDRSRAVIGQATPEIATQVATPLARTVYVYRDAKKPLGIPTGSAVLTAVKTKDGTATALLDREGKTSIVLQTDPAPWFGNGHKQALYLIYGYMDNHTVTRVEYSYSLVQIKRMDIAVHLGGNAGSGESRALVGISINYSW
jgi:hypothetical protein